MTESAAIKLARYNASISAGGMRFMTDIKDMSRWDSWSCSCDGEKLNAAKLSEWEAGLKLFESLMTQADLKSWLDGLSRLHFPNSLKCWHCLNIWMKEVGNEVKVAGKRFSSIFTWYLDLYALAGWTQYNKTEVLEAAQTFCRGEREGRIFYGNDQILNDLSNFLNVHCKFVHSGVMTLDEWLIGRQWANHGTAGDVNWEQFTKLNDVAKDKAALAYAMEAETLEIPEVIDNAVFPKRDRKNRIIVVGATSEYILGSFVNYVFIHSFVSTRFNVSNTKMSVEVDEEIRKHVSSGYYCLPVDQSAFDQNQRKDMVLLVRNWLINNVHLLTNDDRLKWLLTSGDETISVEGKMLGSWESGLLSGKWYTSSVGSLLNAFEIFYCNGKSWADFYGLMLNQGDDAQVCVKNSNAVSRILDNAMNNGVPINPTKNFVDVFRTDYLHRMYLYGPACVQFGDKRMTAEMQVLSYATRALTSILWGDQDSKKESTTANTQSTKVAKIMDRAFAVMSRMNTNCWDTLSEKFQLNELENNFIRTPAALGGLGVWDLGPPSYYVVRAGGKRSVKLGLVKGFGGYKRAIALTEAAFGERFDYDDVTSAIESTLKFKSLPTEKSLKLKSFFYDLVRSDISKKVMLSKKKVQFTRDNVHDPQSLPLQPRLSQRPVWAAAGNLLLGGMRHWDAASAAAYGLLRKAGTFILKSWVKGEISASQPYSLRLAPEQLSKLARRRSYQLLGYLINHRSRDINRLKFLQLKCEIELLLYDECNDQFAMYVSR